MSVQGAEPSVAVERRVVAPSTDIRTRVRDLLRYRELLSNLVRKELKVRYKNSALGFFWSMLNPAMYLVIFWLVFTNFLGADIPYFPVYLLSGLLGWNLLSGSLNGAVGSIIGNSSLVTKVYFPREVLPLSAIGASLVHFLLQLVVLLGALFLFGIPLTVVTLTLVPLALLTLLLFLTGMSLLLSVLNVYFRDVQHLLEVLLLAWFWMTPIVYPISFVAQNVNSELLWRVYLLNPATPIVLAFQRGIYGDRARPDGSAILLDAPFAWYLYRVGLVALASLALVAVGWWLFRRLESRLAEEL